MIKYSNNAATTLASAINSSVTSLTVVDASEFPTLSAGNELRITLSDVTNTQWEIVKCTAVVGNTLTIVRAQEDTNAAAWALGVNVSLRVTAGGMEAKADKSQVLTDVPSGALFTDTNTTYSVGDGGLTQKNFTTADNTKLDGIATSANNYSLPSSVIHQTELSGSIISSSTTIAANLAGVKAAYDRAWPNTTYSVGNGGLTEINFTSADNTKLDGIAASANNYSLPSSVIHQTELSNSVSSTSTTIAANLAGVKAAYDRSWPNTTYSVGDGGLTQHNFTSADHNKLNGIATSANNYSFPETISESANGSTVVKRTVNGYIYGSYFNGTGTFSTSGSTSGMGIFTGTNGSDTYGRSYTAAAARTLLNVADGANNYSLPASVIHQTELSGSVISSSTTIAANLAGVKAAYDRSWPNTTYNFAGATFTSRNSSNVLAIDNAHANTIGYTNASSAAGYSDGGMFVAAYNSTWVSQIFSNFRTGAITTRGKNNGTWGSWRTQWDNLNDGSGSGLDADLLDGVQASGFVTRSTAGSMTVSQGAIHFQESNSNNGAHSYAIFQEGGAWAHPYPDLRIAYHTGIKLGAHTTYGGTRFYNDSNMATLLLSVGNGNNDVSATGNITAYASDVRLKHKFKPIESALDKVQLLNGVTYEWNSEACKLAGFESHSSKVEAGFKAQEVQAVLPEVISLAPFDRTLGDADKSKSGEDYLTVDYARIMPLLVEAIKEQQTQIDELKALVGGA